MPWDPSTEWVDDDLLLNGLGSSSLSALAASAYPHPPPHHPLASRAHAHARIAATRAALAAANAAAADASAADASIAAAHAVLDAARDDAAAACHAAYADAVAEVAKARDASLATVDAVAAQHAAALHAAGNDAAHLRAILADSVAMLEAKIAADSAGTFVYDHSETLAAAEDVLARANDSLAALARLPLAAQLASAPDAVFHDLELPVRSLRVTVAAPPAHMSVHRASVRSLASSASASSGNHRCRSNRRLPHHRSKASRRRLAMVNSANSSSDNVHGESRSNPLDDLLASCGNDDDDDDDDDGDDDGDDDDDSRDSRGNSEGTTFAEPKFFEPAAPTSQPVASAASAVGSSSGSFGLGSDISAPPPPPPPPFVPVTTVDADDASVLSSTSSSTTTSSSLVVGRGSELTVMQRKVLINKLESKVRGASASTAKFSTAASVARHVRPRRVRSEANSASHALPTQLTALLTDESLALPQLARRLSAEYSVLSAKFEEQLAANRMLTETASSAELSTPWKVDPNVALDLSSDSDADDAGSESHEPMPIRQVPRADHLPIRSGLPPPASSHLQFPQSKLQPETNVDPHVVGSQKGSRRHSLAGSPPGSPVVSVFPVDPGGRRRRTLDATASDEVVQLLTTGPPRPNPHARSAAGDSAAAPAMPSVEKEILQLMASLGMNRPSAGGSNGADFDAEVQTSSAVAALMSYLAKSEARNEYATKPQCPPSTSPATVTAAPPPSTSPFEHSLSLDGEVPTLATTHAAAPSPPTLVPPGGRPAELISAATSPLVYNSLEGHMRDLFATLGSRAAADAGDGESEV
ncbi:uncharacterized protein AMSG_03591 [Thecamonas trahens ATCC 50062]|uniref:Uncharacterized protein n=1 Tax=Thecamonas trahens ATCC 50062 TaxID=461836 RepID=A0A0L0D790_THETB|nr:hypothetical protein AMSG_03591 [Thecamonas trahens ATCC 50062]KNC47163.1 hypothetical protein AMSG_03591 [Thecamonas trahens ATCC 50062]|eukprot:XP_013759937.1 hypothetical protein AMSG_03591 [Thecamonas trahens ATCC 50062]